MCIPCTNISIGTANTANRWGKQMGFDFYTAYCKQFGATYGAHNCPTREEWDAMCRQPRKVRKFTDAEFDHNQFSEENGDGAIY
jgi:hypothetical protein